MSTPNPLHRYRSYQYHFIIVVAKTEVLKKLDANLDIHDLSRFNRPEGGPQNKYDAKSGESGQYCILYNSMVDTEYSIESLNLDHHLQTGENGSGVGVSNSVGTSLTIEVVEPYTAEFITAIEYCAQNSGQTLNDFYAGLKVIFVGYLDDANSNKPHIIHTVNTVPFYVGDLDLSVTPKMTKYDMRCFPLINNAADNPNVTKIGGTNVTLPELLKDAIKAFETALNDNAQRTQKDNTKDTVYKYKIVLDKEYEDPKYKLDNVANDQKDAAIGKNVTTKYTVRNNGTIKQSLNDIMTMSTEVNKAVSEVDDSDPHNAVLHGYRILTDQKVDGGNVEITFAIMRVDTPTSDGASTKKQATTQENTTDDTKLTDPLVFDYMYTGVNVDVLQFDMNVTLNLQTVPSVTVIHPDSTPDNKKVNEDNDGVNGNNTSDKAGEHRDLKQSSLDPTTTGSEKGPKSPSTVDPMRIGSGALHPETLFAARKNLSVAISRQLGKKSCMLKIMGNPLLLAGYTPPADLFESQDSGQIKQKMDEHEQTTGGSLTTIPKVTVNVRVPKPAYMQGAKQGTEDNFYSSPFWDWAAGYLLMKISSRFAKGEFTQVLELRALPEGGNVSSSDIKAPKPTEKNEDNKNQPSSESPTVMGDNVKAFLDMISHAEGTYGHGDNGYNIRWGGVQFDGYSDHPWHIKPWPGFHPQKKKDGSTFTPTPAGRYQILVGTYDANKASCGGDFTPSSQDKMAIKLMKIRKAYDLVVAGKPKDAINKLKLEWSSLKSTNEDKLLKWYEQHGGTYEPQKTQTVAGTQTGSTSGNTAKSTGNSAGVNKLNDALTGGTQDAINKGVKYKYNNRDSSTGAIDCSGWVIENNGKAAAASNDPAVKEGSNLIRKGGTAAGIVQTVGNASGQELSGSDVNTSNLKPGMVIGIDYSQGGAKSGAGRYKGIDHIVQVVQNPSTGKLQISESSSGKGVHLTDADTWLARTKSKPRYAVDPYYKTR
jgi:muramidase (phage lysozyme)